MDFLLIDDGEDKFSRLRDFLVEDLGIDPGTTQHARNSVEAREMLRAKTYDLVIMDIMLPRKEGDPPSASVAVDLLNDLMIDDQFQRPRFIVGLTAFDDVRTQIDSEFREKFWTIIHCDPTSDEWLQRIKLIANFLKPTQQANAKYDLDLCILCALEDPEINAVHKLPWGWSLDRPIDECIFVRDGQFTSAGKTYSAATVHIPRMGMVASAITTANIIQRLRPKVIVMVGICAGVRGKSELGDVIVANPAWNYESGKHKVDADGKHASFAPSPHQLDIAEPLASKVRMLARQADLFQSIQQNWTPPVARTPRLIVGPVASGSAVVANKDILDRVIEQQRDLVGLEMEIYGMYAAAQMATAPVPLTIAFKGVSDFADTAKDDSARHYAAYAAANVMKEYFERFMADFLTR